MALTETKCVANKAFDKVVLTKIQGILQTELIEEITGVQKNRKRLMTLKTLRNADVTLSLTPQSGICHDTHRFEAFEIDSALMFKIVKLPTEAFDGDTCQHSLRFDDIVSASAGQEHFSPASNNRCVIVADHEFLDQALQQTGDTTCLDAAWLFRLLDATHDLAAALRADAKSLWCYHLACADFGDSSCLVRPADVLMLPGAGTECSLLKDSLVVPVLRALFDPKAKNVCACRIEWLAPFNLDCDYPSWRGHVPIGVRAFRKGPWRSLHQIAAHACFWTWPQTFLKHYADYYFIELPLGATHCVILWQLIKAILKLGDAATLNIIRPRLVDYDLSTLFAELIICCDEAQDVLEEADINVLEGDQNTARERLIRKSLLKDEFKKKDSGIKTRPACPPAKKARKASADSLPEGSNFSESYEDQCDITQPEAKTWLPPGASIWRAYKGFSRL